MQKKIGKYTVTEQVGSGSAGVVYRAQDPDILRNVAIKVIKAEYFGTPDVRAKSVEQFTREIRAIGSLAHPNIVSIFDSGLTSEGLPYLVMQYVEGRGLDLIVRDDGALNPARAIDILRQLADAIDYTHQQKVIHRDIKPSNILVGPNDHIFIVDFSTAIGMDEPVASATHVIGTPQFMAPEVILGDKANASSDLYSLGIIAFLLFTGKNPFREGGVAATFNAALRTSAFSFEQLGCSLGAKLERALRRAIAKDPKDRFQTATEFIDECERALANQELGVFSQVAHESGASADRASGAYRVDKARRINVVRWPGMRPFVFATTFVVVTIATILSVPLFYLDFNSSLNRQARSLFKIGYSDNEISQMSSSILIQVLASDMPSQTMLSGIRLAREKNTAELASTLAVLTRDPRAEVRIASVRALMDMSSLAPEARKFMLENGLEDADPFIRIFAANELAKSGKEAKALIEKRKAVESDTLVKRSLEFILSKL